MTSSLSCDDCLPFSVTTQTRVDQPDSDWIGIHDLGYWAECMGCSSVIRCEAKRFFPVDRDAGHGIIFLQDAWRRMCRAAG